MKSQRIQEDYFRIICIEFSFLVRLVHASGAGEHSHCFEKIEDDKKDANLSNEHTVVSCVVARDQALGVFQNSLY